MKDGNGGDIGLSLLGSMSAFSIWAAANPSFFTIKAFNTPEQEHNVRFGMKIGLVLNLVLGGALLLAYKKKGRFPAIMAAGTGIALWAGYDYVLKHRDGSEMSYGK